RKADVFQSAGAWLVLVLLVAAPGAWGAEGASPKVPVALVWEPGGRVRVALRDARALLEVDPGEGRLLGERPLPFRPCSMVAAVEGAVVLVGGMDGEMAAVDAEGRVVYEA